MYPGTTRGFAGDKGMPTSPVVTPYLPYTPDSYICEHAPQRSKAADEEASSQPPGFVGGDAGTQHFH